MMKESVRYIQTLMVDDKVVKSLEQLDFSPNGTKRFCLHDSPEAPLHVMAIEVEAGAEYPPHLHTDSDEVMFLLAGQMEILIWNNGTGNSPVIIQMDSSMAISPVVFVPRSVVHLTRPLKRSSYMEVKMGPFKKDALEVIEKSTLVF